MLFTRKALEELEDQSLSTYALRASQSAGREFSEAESEYRTAFQKDRDRVNHTTAFRRLQYKTQVFVNHEGDYYRTRLTHTLEVSQVAKSICRALGLNQDLAETIAFSHDLGHPPFGHSGENVLDDLMKDFGGFDHNKQSMRIVRHLERRYSAFNGLNLTWETREGIAKHEPNHVSPSGQTNQNPSLEAQIVNLADEIAYNAHDLDDGLKSGLLQAPQIFEVKLLAEMLEQLRLRPSAMDELARRTLIRELLNVIITDTIHQTNNSLEKLRINSPSAVRSHSQKIAGYSEKMAVQLVELKRFLFANLYRHPHVNAQVTHSKIVLEYLFGMFVLEPDLMPLECQNQIDSEGVHRVVCDYIAGMTDRFALEEYERLRD